MNDERIVKTLAREMQRWGAHFANDPLPQSLIDDASDLLAALRADSFDVYRPEECEPVIEDSVFDDESGGAVIVYRTAYRGEGDYRLVPVPEPQEGE